MKGTVLVTGANGFVGRELVRHLAADGWRVVAAARGTSGLEAAGAAAVLALPDLGKPVHWAPLLGGVTHAVHVAGISPTTPDIPEDVYRAVNAEAAGSLAAAARAKGLARLVLLSSIRAACGPSAPAPVRETDTPAPTDAYGRSKLAGELHVAEKLDGGATSFVILRPAVVYGPGVRGNMSELMKLAASPLPLPIAGLKGRRSLLSLGNLASAVSHVLTAGGASGGTFLAADDESLTPAEIVTALRSGLGRSPGIVKAPVAGAGAIAQMLGKGEQWVRLMEPLIADTSRLKATGWQPVERAEAALAKLMGTVTT